MPEPTWDPIICEAIRTRRVLEFDYNGKHRVVHPYCHGLTRKGQESLRAVQVDGTSRPDGFGFGKMWTVAQMELLRLTDVEFPADDPDYNPADSAMMVIHCCVDPKKNDE
jgi:hypothetical protein